MHLMRAFAITAVQRSARQPQERAFGITAVQSSGRQPQERALPITAVPTFTTP